MNDNANSLNPGRNARFAAAAQPIAAQSVIHTGTDGLAVGTARLTIGGQEVPVYHA